MILTSHSDEPHALMEIVKQWAALRSKDPRTKVAACIYDTVKKGMYIGYNGFPPGIPDESEIWERTSSTQSSMAQSSMAQSSMAQSSMAPSSMAQSSVPIGTDAGAQNDCVHGIPMIDNHGRAVATVPMQSRFDSRLKWLAQRGIPFHTQKQLPIVGYAGVVEAAMELVLSKGGEGLVLKKNDSLYETCRSCWMLKYKPFSDDEGIVVGTTPGLGRLQGMIGALVINWKGRQFELAGLTDVERSLGADKWIGRKVTFKYRTLTRDGLPSEARYWRDRTELE